MISSVLAMTLAAASFQPADTTRSAREAYQGCLRTFLNQSVEARTPVADFESAITQQCTAEGAAYRAAVIQRETAARSPRPAAERAAEDEIGEARDNAIERYRYTMEPE